MKVWTILWAILPLYNPLGYADALESEGTTTLASFNGLRGGEILAWKRQVGGPELSEAEGGH